MPPGDWSEGEKPQLPRHSEATRQTWTSESLAGSGSSTFLGPAAFLLCGSMKHPSFLTKPLLLKLLLNLSPNGLYEEHTQYFVHKSSLGVGQPELLTWAVRSPLAPRSHGVWGHLSRLACTQNSPFCPHAGQLSTSELSSAFHTCFDIPDC